MTYHPAVELYVYATSNGALFRDVQLSYGTLDAHYGMGTFNHDSAKALLASNAKSAARHMVANTPTGQNVEEVRRTFRNRDVQDACASIMLYQYLKQKGGERHA